MNRLFKRISLTLGLALLLTTAGVVGFAYLHDAGSQIASIPVADLQQQLHQGSYLARAANCMGCHTSRGGAAYAGGRQIATPFGDMYTPNITPDAATGIGRWSSDDFWRALHNGKSRDGHLLYPAFPYTEYTKMSRPDSDAMFAYFKTLAPVQQENRPHALRFPYNQRVLLACWRALYFRPGVYVADSTQTVEWNRGAYLVQGAGHCSACHASRNALGATEGGIGLAGGLMPASGWYAPSLTSDAQAGLGTWDRQQIVSLLKTGISQQGTVFGPMAEVVQTSLQHLSDTDLGAMATYLKSLPPTADERNGLVASERPSEALMQRGAALYSDHCVACHQANGRGVASVYPALAGNRALTMGSAINPIRIVLNGGFAPGTAGNPRPYGMAPYGPFLNDVEVAAVVTYVRNAWGNQASPVSAQTVGRNRAVPVD